MLTLHPLLLISLHKDTYSLRRSFFDNNIIDTPDKHQGSRQTDQIYNLIIPKNAIEIANWYNKLRYHGGHSTIGMYEHT